MDLIIPDWPVPPHIGALSTTRRGGVSVAPYDDGSGSGMGGFNLGAHVGDRPADVTKNRALLTALLPATPAWLTQVHGVQVIDAATAVRDGSPEADASVAGERGAVCLVQTADCLPVLFCDVDGRVVGAAHAGWRGLVNGVLENAVAAMRRKGASDIIAWLGPAIGPQQFEVGEEVRAAFIEGDAAARHAFVPRPDRHDKFLANIYLLARQRLARIGVTHCYGGNCCTVEEKDRFFSYRRDRITGRMASLIWIK